MLIVMQTGASETQIRSVCERIVALGLKAHPIPGKSRTAIGITGNSGQDHADELANHVAAIESDSGGFRPVGYSVDCADESRLGIAAEQLRDIMSLLASIGKLTVGHLGLDVGLAAGTEPLYYAGVRNRNFGYDASDDTVWKLDWRP